MTDVLLSGPCGRLEALYEAPEGDREPRGAAVVCHPHPLHGGTLQNTIVFRTARALRAEGLATLRFNFRGVGESEGKYDGDGGEEGDVVAGLDWLEQRTPGVPLWAAGYSFGARTVCGTAQRDRRIRRLVCVALPLRSLACPGLESLTTPAFFLFGGIDEFGRLSDLKERLPAWPAHFDAVEIPEADHFFRRLTPKVEENVRAFAARSLENRTP